MKPTPKTPAPKRATVTRARKPRKMWAYRDAFNTMQDFISLEGRKNPARTSPVLVIPLTEESIAAMREKVAAAEFMLNTGQNWEAASPIDRRVGRERADAFLRAIGLTASTDRKRGDGRKGK